MKIRTVAARLTPADKVVLFFLALLTLLNLVFYGRLPDAAVWSAANAAIIIAVLAVSEMESRKSRWILEQLHRWYLYPMILFIYNETNSMNYLIQGRDFDQALLLADRWLFGGDPALWTLKFSTPVLTEFFQIAYFSYYFLFIIFFIELFRRYSKIEVDKASYVIVYGFCLSYVGYLLVPAVGPRFMLFDFRQLDTELPGLYATGLIRAFLNNAEKIPAIGDPTLGVHRNCFPSGHTMMTVTLMALAVRYRLRVSIPIIAMGSMLVLSTVYLRYHYVVDVLAGLMLVPFVLWSAQALAGTGHIGRPRTADASKVL